MKRKQLFLQVKQRCPANQFTKTDQSPAAPPATYLRVDGLYLESVKKNRSQVIDRSSRLQAADNGVNKLEGISFQRHLFHNHQGQGINSSTFKGAWQRLMKRAYGTGLQVRFTFHDLKAKGVSDFEGDKQLDSGYGSD